MSPVSRPMVGSMTERVYAQLGPVSVQDQALGWPLLTFIQALCMQFQVVEDIAADQGSKPGWSQVLDVDRCPAGFLPWLGQFVGVRLDPTLSVANQRLAIKATGGWKRGTRAAMIAAIQPYLTGAKQVILTERDTDAYHFAVVTYTAQTPDVTAVDNVIKANKPTGLKYTYSQTTGSDYLMIKVSAQSTYTLIKSHFATYAAIKASPSG